MSHNKELRSDKKNDNLSKLIKTEDVRMSGEYVRLEHGSVQYVGDGRKANHGVRNPVHRILEDMDLKDVVAFSYNNSKQIDVRNKRKVLLGNVNPLYLSDENENADDSMSKTKDTANMTEEGDENSGLDVWPDYVIRALIVEA